MSEHSSRLHEAVNTALAKKQTVRIIGEGSKAFLYSGDSTVPLLNVSDHKGVVEYRPEELVITVRAGTSLAELKETVASQGQMWACDPPEFDGRGTVGGAIASGLCGPGRPWYGSLRDSLLGVELINGFGEPLRFGGKVIKNVAGFDVSRILAGSQGTLGIILSASLKLIPLPEHTRSIAVSRSSRESASMIAHYTKKTSTLTGTCYHHGTLYLRFTGVAAAVENDMRDFASTTEIDPKFWQELRDHSTTFFADDAPLWRITLSRGSWYHEENPDQSTASLAEWNGALLWYKTQSAVCPNLSMNSHSARSFRNIKHEPQEPSKYSLRLKHAFDPQKIFNPGVVL